MEIEAPIDGLLVRYRNCFLGLVAQLKESNSLNKANKWFHNLQGRESMLTYAVRDVATPTDMGVAVAGPSSGSTDTITPLMGGDITWLC